MTVIRARVHPQRSVSFDMFADITDAAVTSLLLDRSTGEWVVTFDRDIDPVIQGQPPTNHAEQVRDRMTSRDDADQAARAILRNADTATNRWKLLRSYVLGDPMPEPIYPPE